MGELAIAVRREGGYAVIATDGYINNLGGEKIRQAALELLAAGYKQLVLNLACSTVVNSIGVSILIDLLERVQDSDGKVCFCQLTRVIAKTFTIMGLTQNAQIAESEAEAIARLTSGPISPPPK